MSRQLPGASDYQQVLLNLHVALIPPHLKAYTFVPGKRGPIIYSGGFVMTSPIHNPAGSKLALRLFYRLPDDMEKRYRSISSFVQQHRATGIFADVQYVENGVKVGPSVFPICTMEWLEGDTLRRYVSKNINDPGKIRQMPENFLKMIEKLRRIGAAHGDLSHENIMIVNDEFKLVDYDGMYLPDLNGLPPVVAGQENFQHPERMKTPGYFGPYQDDFSAIAIYISLLALAHDPTLYNRYENGGNSLLFKRDDFLHPEQSPFLADIEKLDPGLATLAQGFREVCAGELLQVPSLPDFIRGKRSTSRISLNPAALSGSVVYSTEGNPVFNATSPNRNRLRSAQGHIALVGGRVNAVKALQDQILLEFTDGVTTTFVVFLEGDAYAEIMKKGTLNSYQNQWVKVTGLVELNTINGQEIPAIMTDTLQDVAISTQLQVLNLFRTGSEVTTSSTAPAEAQTNWRKTQLKTQPPPATNQPTNTGSSDGALRNLQKKNNPFGSLTDN